MAAAWQAAKQESSTLDAQANHQTTHKKNKRANRQNQKAHPLLNPGSLEEGALLLVHLSLAALSPVLSNVLGCVKRPKILNTSDSFYETTSHSP